MFLAFAYEHGDLSRVFPIARGTAPLLVPGASTAVLDEGLAASDAPAVLVLGVGVLAMGGGAFASGGSRRVVPLALASAAMTAGYSLTDGIGARVAGSAALYVAWMFLVDARVFVPLLLAIRGRVVLTADRRVWVLGGAAAALSYRAYQVAVRVMTKAAHRTDHGAARDIDPLRGSDRLARLWRADGPDQDRGGRSDRGGLGADTGLRSPIPAFPFGSNTPEWSGGAAPLQSAALQRSSASARRIRLTASVR